MQRGGNTPPKKPGRVSLPLVVTPPKGHPFAGATGLNAPARDTRIPDLTAHVALAAAQKQRLQQGGLLTPQQQKTEAAAAKVLAKKPPAKTATPPAGAKRSAPESAPHPPTGLRGAPTPPLVQIGAPPAPPLARQSAAPGKPTTLPNLPVGPRAGMVIAQSKAPHGQIADLSAPNYTSLGGGESWGTAAKNAAHAIDLGLGTAAATALAGVGIGPTSVLTAKVNAPGALKTTSQAASQLSNAGLSLPKVVLVPGAGAKSTQMTPQKLVAAGMTEAQTKHFRDMAIHKRHWDPGEVNDLVGLDLLKHAFNNAPSGIVGNIVRTAQNFGSGVIRSGSLPVAGVAIGQEIASGHGTRALKEIGDAFSSQIGGAISNPGQAFRDDPYAFLPVAGAGLKTLGGVGGKLAEKAGKEAADRTVTHALTGKPIELGKYDRNLYTATGQHIKDAATSRSAFLSKKVSANSVDNLVSDVSNETAPLHHGVQVDYAQAFKRVKPKRAALLMSINKAGGKPEKILEFYRRSGNERQVKHWTQVVEASKNLSEKDHAFIAAHKAMAASSTGAGLEREAFGETAAVYRAHQPLILSDAHAGDPAAQRVQALHEEWVKALRTTDDPATLEPLHGAYDHAVREYAAGHLAAGGAEPARVAYTPPPSTGVMTSPYTRGAGGKVKFNARTPRQKASTGAAFESGNYIIDPKAALRENLQAQRLRTSIGLTSDESLAKIGAIKAARGDERPHGYVFTPAQNPATVGKITTDLHDAPVGAHDYYERESQIRDSFAKKLKAGEDKTGEHAATAGWFVPEGAWNRILDYTRPESRAAYDKFIRQYSRAMISLFPGTVIGNTLGSAPLALAAGAITPGPWKKAMESSSFRGDVSLVPHSLHGRGVAGSLAADIRVPGLGQYMNKMRRGSVIGEDLSRDAAYFAKALQGAKKRSREHGYDNVNDYLRDMATGKVDPEIRDQAIAHAIKFAGDAGRPATKTGKQLGRVILFPAWLQHMTKLMVFTLPIHHPRRMVLINALAQYGDQYRKEHGALPSWMQEFAPILRHTIGNQAFNMVASLSPLSPAGTAGGFFDQIGNGYSSLPERLLGLANPVVQAGVNSAIVQPIKNVANPRKAVDLSQYAQNQALYTIPGMSKAFPRTGYKSTSRPWDPQEKTYTYIDPDGNTVKVPWSQRPGARPVGGPLGIASRLAGFNLYDVPAPDSAINKRQVGTEIHYAKKKK